MEEMSFLKSLPLLSKLTSDEKAIISQYFILKSYLKNTAILRQGIEGNGLYILRHGKVAAYINNVDGSTTYLAHIHEGDFFGEISLLDDLPTTASVIAETDTTCFFLHKKYFHAFLLLYPNITQVLGLNIAEIICNRIRQSTNLIRKTIKIDPLHSLNTLLTQTVFSNTPKRINLALLKKYSDHLNKLWCFTHFNSTEIQHFIKHLKQLFLKQNEILFREGALEIDTCYIILAGALQSTITRGHFISKLKVLGPGFIAGHFEWFDQGPRLLTCVAREDTQLLVVNKKQLSALFKKEPIIEYKFYQILYMALSHSFRTTLIEISRLQLPIA